MIRLLVALVVAAGLAAAAATPAHATVCMTYDLNPVLGRGAVCVSTT